MPFQSEKQRRFLWAEHPDIAKRWAHEYPNKKKLPLYAHEQKDTSAKRPTPSSSDKKATIVATETAMKFANINDPVVNTVGLRIYGKWAKQADSTAVKVTIPSSEKPVAAGEEHISVKSTDENNPAAELGDCHSEQDQQDANALMAKLSVVLSQSIQQAVADEEARQQGAEAQQVPQNSGLKTYPQATPGIAPPMGMTQQPAQAQAQQAQGQAQGTLPPVGGGTSPSANPINSYGGISTSGDINGNAAFGAPGGGKTAGKLGLWDRIRAKKERGGKPAKPGDKDYPDAKSWKKVTEISEKAAKLAPDDAEDMRSLKQRQEAYKKAPAWKKVIFGRDLLSKTPYLEDGVDAEKQSGTPAWQRAAGKNDEGGLNEKGRKSYEREHGGNLKAPVTEKNPKGKAKARQNSFCSRMCGMKRVNTGAETKKDPDSRINKSLRKWNCKCSSAMEFGIKMAAATGEELGGSLGGLAGGNAGLFGGLAAAQYLDNPTNIDALRFTHGLNSAKHMALSAGGKALGMSRPLNERLSHLGSNAVLKALQFLPKSNMGRLAMSIGLPAAGLFGVGLPGVYAGRALGRQFDAPQTSAAK